MIDIALYYHSFIKSRFDHDERIKSEQKDRMQRMQSTVKHGPEIRCILDVGHLCELVVGQITIMGMRNKRYTHRLLVRAKATYI